MSLAAKLPPLWPGEAAAVAAGIPARQREFAGGRAAARMALASVGIAPAALPALPDRSPGWPKAIRGSIAHSATLAIAVAGPASAWKGLGVDLEPEGQVNAELSTLLLRPEERYAAIDPTAAFCAKEAVQKALFPETGELLEFLDLGLKRHDRGFSAELQRPTGTVPAGTEIEVRLARAGGHVVAAALWPSTAPRNNAPSLAASA